MMAKSAKKTSGKSDSADTPRVYLIYGDEFKVSGAARELVDRLCPESEQTLGLEIIDGRLENGAEAVVALHQCLEALRTVGFFGGRKVVWLRDANCFHDGGSGRSAEVKDCVRVLAEEIQRGLTAEQALVISAPKVDGRSAFFKTCKAHAQLTGFASSGSAYKVEEEAGDWALQVFRRQGLRIQGDVLAKFMQKTGTDSRQIVQEVQKLDVYMGGRKDVQAADLAAVVSATRENVAWDLADAVGKRELPKALRILRQLLFQQESVVGLIIALEIRFRDLLILRSAMDRGWLRIEGGERWRKLVWSDAPEVEETLSTLNKDPRKTHPYRAGLLVEQASKFSEKALIRRHAEVVATHEKLVSSSLPAALLMECMLVRVIGKRAAAGG